MARGRGQAGRLVEAVLPISLGSKFPAGGMDQSLNGRPPHQSSQSGEPATGTIEPADQGVSAARRRQRLG
jgi:hypothetical protein